MHSFKKWHLEFYIIFVWTELVLFMSIYYNRILITICSLTLFPIIYIYISPKQLQQISWFDLCAFEINLKSWKGLYFLIKIFGIRIIFLYYIAASVQHNCLTQKKINNLKTRDECRVFHFFKFFFSFLFLFFISNGSEKY